MSMPRMCFLLGMGLILSLLAERSIGTMLTDDERVDRDTKLALHLDVNRAEGAKFYALHCANCHGGKAQGQFERVIPALAGQRFNHLVRQLANFSDNERDSQAMHGIARSVLEHQPQVWVNLAGHLII